MNQQRNGRGMYTDPSSGYRYEGNLTILWCPVRGQWGGGEGGRGDITSLVLSTEMTSDDNVDRPPQGVY